MVLGAHADEIRAAVDLRRRERRRRRGLGGGQSASLRAGVAAVPDADAVVVVLGDQPFLSPAAIEAVLGARGDGADAVRATYGGVPGHPIVLERALFDADRAPDAGTRARGPCCATRARVACDGLGRPDDIDTPEDLDAATGGADPACTPSAARRFRLLLLRGGRLLAIEAPGAGDLVVANGVVGALGRAAVLRARLVQLGREPLALCALARHVRAGAVLLRFAQLGALVVLARHVAGLAHLALALVMGDLRPPRQRDEQRDDGDRHDGDHDDSDNVHISLPPVSVGWAVGYPLRRAPNR